MAVEPPCGMVTALVPEQWSAELGRAQSVLGAAPACRPITVSPARRGPSVWRWQPPWCRRGSRTPAGRRSGRRPSRSGQRVWKRHPGGGAAGDGMSPSSTIRSRARCRAGFGTRDRRQQRLGVRVLRARVHLVGRALLDDPPEVHHRDAVAHVAHEREVVGDEQVGERRARACRSPSRLMTSAWIDTSRLLTGSSSTSSLGESASARAIATRWSCPPENSRGYRLRWSGLEAAPCAAARRRARSARLARRGRGRCASARPGCRRSSRADRTTSTGPGTPPACRGAARGSCVPGAW